MIFPPTEIDSMISRELTLCPDDNVACGTSLGVGPVRSDNVVEVIIEGVGCLRNRFEDKAL